MILIFGGTTEGKLATSVCDEAGKTFYYSTKSGRQEVDMLHGIHISGAMTATDITEFCREKGISCIINASHPFAECLHSTIEQCHLPVIRLQREFTSRQKDIVYCEDYAEAIEKLTSANINNLLALSGANTIAKLKPYWQSHNTTFRILNRDESLAIALKENLPKEKILFYNESLSLPTIQEEKDIMLAVGCDAILTKESGDNGGFDIKVDAARQLGIRVFVIKHPTLPQHWTYVTGKYSLRKAIEKIVPDFFPLKTGFTTGACATAAAKAALLSLLHDEQPEEISFALPDGEVMSIPVNIMERGVASVVKDFSDDPDVTRGCKIIVKVEHYSGKQKNVLRFLQGKGVGRVTLPGLGIPVGEPAINPTPRRMIEEEFRAISTESFDITVSVENGEELAKRTFNHKVGVVDGISIIGTSGIVKPLSNEAFVQSIRRELEVARAIGCTEIGLVAGMKSELALKEEIPELRCVHYGNFIGDALKAAHQLGFSTVWLSVMIGKAVKLAEGHMDTHSHKVQMNKNFLCKLAPERADDIQRITMARELWDIMPQAFFDKIKKLCLQHCQEVFPEGKIHFRLICDNQHQ